jgi:hypothetical protein
MLTLYFSNSDILPRYAAPDKHSPHAKREAFGADASFNILAAGACNGVNVKQSTEQQDPLRHPERTTSICRKKGRLT